MLRVLMTIDAVGGVWRYALDLARCLASHDMKFLLAGFGPPPQMRQPAEFGELRNVDVVWTDEPLDWTVDDPLLLDAATQRLAALARQWRADVVHVNAPSQAAGLTCRQPVVVVSHSCVATWWAAVRQAPLSEGWSWHLDRNRRGLDRADIVVAPSDSHRQALARVYGNHHDCRVVYNAVPAATGDATRQKLIVSVGRWWDEGKNGAVLDAAAPASPWPVVLAGPLLGPRGQVVHFASVEATGSLPHAEVQALIRRAAVFAAPSLYEPFGLAVAEAASAGAALVLSDIPTFQELWGGAALFVPPRQPARWADAFQRLAADNTLRDHLAAAAIRRAADFTPVRQAAAMLGVYDAAKAAGAP